VAELEITCVEGGAVTELEITCVEAGAATEPRETGAALHALNEPMSTANVMAAARRRVSCGGADERSQPIHVAEANCRRAGNNAPSGRSMPGDPGHASKHETPPSPRLQRRSSGPEFGRTKLGATPN
jgi:hypothetical protein